MFSSGSMPYPIMFDPDGLRTDKPTIGGLRGMIRLANSNLPKRNQNTLITAALSFAPATAPWLISTN